MSALDEIADQIRSNPLPKAVKKKKVTAQQATKSHFGLSFGPDNKFNEAAKTSTDQSGRESSMSENISEKHRVEEVKELYSEMREKQALLAQQELDLRDKKNRKWLVDRGKSHCLDFQDQ